MTERKVRFGLTLPTRGILFGATRFDELLEMAALAEESGYFDSIWVGDSLYAKPRVDAIATLAAVAARTKRVRLGPACFASFPLRNPLVLAYQWASLDLISGGRTIMVPCIGGGSKEGGGDFEVEFRAMNIRYEERVARLEEGIKILRKLWTEEGVTFRGKFYSFDGLTLEPKPVQKPCPPIWIANNPQVFTKDSKVINRALKRVARLGDGWMTSVLNPSEFRKMWDQILQYTKEAGRDPSHMESCLHHNLNINNNEEMAASESQQFLAAYYSGQFARETLGIWVAFGSVENCISQLKENLSSGVGTFIIRFPSFDQMGQLKRCIKEIMPKLVS